jgi:hypothetical protein
MSIEGKDASHLVDPQDSNGGSSNKIADFGEYKRRKQRRLGEQIMRENMGYDALINDIGNIKPMNVDHLVDGIVELPEPPYPPAA